ncbi:hypothetical protein JY651_43305 [Pyxidicoccus parkwayensis]|jgi:hypothetical protein|uniref:Uncharacterized protein n=1 Tax=Pyxidicoccus parkwayensis TaxID=2813578 RepID=A0ABX7NWR1_9BACT|nr:hypothetical protein [Pyxidicoccus parkwaysis]QSQ21907.1 hypothetical protein JY651_43305 [Pyxidicoccus parkwaysis]
MSQPLTVEALLRLVHQYYPVGLYETDPRYESTEEFKRLDKLRRAAVDDASAWNAFLLRVREKMPECSVWDYPNIRYDPAYSLRLGLPGHPEGAAEHKEVVLMVCILAPVHVLYADHSKHVGDITETITYQPPLPMEFQPFAEKLEALAIETFGTTRLSQDVLSTPVPEFQVGTTGFGKVTLADCLFGDHRW